MTDLSGRVVAITGASSGIGEAIALACARSGATVILAARRTERIEALAGHIAGDGGHAVAVPTDVADEAQANAFVERAHRELGRLDVLVNNAGVMMLGPIEGAPTEEWRRMVDVNIMGLLYCTHAALPLMRAQGSGHVVNISSVGGRVVGRYSAVYSLTKFGVGAFSEALRQECMDANVRVTVIEPGRVDTEVRTHTRQEVLDAVAGSFAGVTPLSAGEIANTVVWTIGQPENVVVSEVLVRPARSPM